MPPTRLQNFSAVPRERLCSTCSRIHSGPCPAAPQRRQYRSREHEPTYAQRQFVLRRDGFRCVSCESTHRLEIDHVTPVARGGETVVGNLQTLCKRCHQIKTNVEQGRGKRFFRRRPRGRTVKAHLDQIDYGR